MNFIIIYITNPTKEEAKKIALHLLEKKLIACANIYPSNSMYWWEGKIENEDELAIIFKTRTELLDEAMALVKELHSYDVPCLMSYEYTLGDKDYLNWIAEETKK